MGGFAEFFNDAFMAAAVLGTPPLVLSAIVGLTIAIVQAATQIQDQTLPQVVKLFVVAILMVLAGAALGQPLDAVLGRALDFARLGL
jgi:type III secretory pathway component EscS